MRFGIAVDDLITDPSGRVLGIAARTASREPLRASAPITVGADGLRSLVARRAGAPIELRGTGASALIYSYWSGRIAEGYEWFYRPGVSFEAPSGNASFMPFV